MELRPYQTQAVKNVYEAIRQGSKRVVVASCTGSGKTVVMGKIAVDVNSRNKRTLVVVDDSPLIDQTVNKFAKYNLPVGVIKAGYREQRMITTQVASIDTLIRREFPPADVIMVDECHLSFAAKYDRLFEYYADKIFIGFTATPERTNKRESLTKRWDTLVQGLSLMESVAQGFNVPIICYPLPKNSLGLGNIKIKRGEYDEGQLALTMQQENVINRAIDDWKKHAQGRPTICFAVNVAHSKLICEMLNKRGISSEHIDGTTPKDERSAMYSRLRSGKTTILCSVNVLSIGFDEPCVSAILSCRPTKSRPTWIQQAGRGTRLFEGKEDCILIDHSENTWNLGHPMEYTPPDLRAPEDKEKQEAPCKHCPECEVAVLSFLMVCPQCGYKFPEKNNRNEYLGELNEVSPIITNPLLQEQRRVYTELMQQALIKGYNPDYAFVRYKEKYNQYPNTLIKRHALFGKKYLPEDYENYKQYLHDIAAKKQKDDKWIKKHLTSEFGRLLYI